MREQIRFLSLAEVLIIAQDQISRYGGLYGLRDLSLLDSAISMPQARFSGAWLHEGIPAMAAAYAWHICANHPFIDGNKRTALATALVFLDLNGYALECSEEEIYQLMMQTASGLMGKTALTAFFTARCRTESDSYS